MILLYLLDGVIPAGEQSIAAEYAFQRHPSALPCAIFLDRFQCILRTGRRESAAGSVQRRNVSAISANKGQQEAFHTRFFLSRGSAVAKRPARKSCARIVSRISAKGASVRDSCATKIRFIPPRINGMKGVTASRMRRFARLRRTLLPTFLETEKPIFDGRAVCRFFA